MDSSPSLIQIKSEIQHYDSVEKEIDDIKPVIVWGSAELSTGKGAIITKIWEFGRNCIAQSQRK